VESQVGAASTFHFTARFGVGSAAAPPAATIGAEVLRQVPVLIVDDKRHEPHDLEKPSVTGHGAVLAPAGPRRWSGSTRRQRSERPIRLLLTDVHMPEMDGYTSARRFVGERWNQI